MIPLAKKLKDCGVFGVSSDEYLKYAENNRKEWEAKGPEVIAELVQSVRHMKGDRKRDEDEDRSFIPQELSIQEPVERRMSQSQDSLEYMASNKGKDINS